MTTRKRKITGQRWTLQKVVKVLMDEMVYIRSELKSEIADVRRDLMENMGHLETRMNKKFDALHSDFQILRLEVHQNQIAFMDHHHALEKRVEVLETSGAR